MSILTSKETEERRTAGNAFFMGKKGGCDDHDGSC